MKSYTTPDRMNQVPQLIQWHIPHPCLDLALTDSTTSSFLSSFNPFHNNRQWCSSAHELTFNSMLHPLNITWFSSSGSVPLVTLVFLVPLLLLGSSQFIFVGLGVSAWFPGSFGSWEISFCNKVCYTRCAVVKYFTYFFKIDC